MNINAISIVPQDVGCNAKCKYCIAYLTKDVRKDLKKPGINLPKLEKCIKFATMQSASTAIITSSGETLLGSWTNIENILWLCKKYFGQIDLHTNGIEIDKPPMFGRDFSQMLAPYLSNITITVPHYKKKTCLEHGLDVDYEKLFKKLNDLGSIIRLSCVVCKSFSSVSIDNFLQNYITFYKNLGVSQIVFRELWIPSQSSVINDWCRDNYVSKQCIQQYIESLQITKELNWWGNGQPYELSGIAVSTSTCTNNVTKEVVKSVVYRPDNCLYSDWDTMCKMM